MNSVRKILSAACFLAFLPGGSVRLSAQTESAANHLALPPASSIQSTTPNRVYLGTVTRTSVAGKTFKGDILLSVTPAGEVTASLTINGKAHPYYGQVSVKDHGPVASANQTKQRSGTLRAVRKIATLPTGRPVVIATNELPLTITATSAFGGATDPNGSSFVFTAGRIGLAEAAFGLPVGTPVQIGPVGTIVGTKPTGG